MARMLEIIDPDGERRLSRQRKILFLFILISLGLFGYPLAKDYYPKWLALKAGRKLALKLSVMKTKAILEKKALEARFKSPDLIEFSEVSSCGPFAQRAKYAELRLGELEPEMQFVPEAWLRERTSIKEPMLQRFCYDPLYGSSVFADGLAHGGIFLAHAQVLRSEDGEFLTQLLVEGPAGDFSLE